MIITTDQLDTKRQFQQNQFQDYTAQLSDLNKLTSENYTGLQTGQYQRELLQMQQKLANVQAQLSLATKEYERASELLRKGVIAQAKYDKAYFNYVGLQKQLAEIKEQQAAQWQAQKKETVRELRSFQSEIQRLNQESQKYRIIAPHSGTLVDFNGIREGNFLVQGESIGAVASADDLVAECLVSPKNIGFIHLGQKAKFQIDTYNYNQWGLTSGKVIEINRNVVVNEQTGEAHFKVLCKMDQDFLALKNGYKGKISKGMTFTARFHLIDRTLWQLLFDKVDDWFNPKLKT